MGEVSHALQVWESEFRPYNICKNVSYGNTEV